MAGKVPDVPAVHDASVRAQAPAADALAASISLTRDRSPSVLRPRRERAFPLPSANRANGLVRPEIDGNIDRTPRIDCGETDR